jgi:hypothetical protein
MLSLDGEEEVQCGHVDHSGVRSCPNDFACLQPSWLVELSTRSELSRCPLFGLPLMDPVFGINDGSCPIRACSDHAVGQENRDAYADLTMSSNRLVDLDHGLPHSHLSVVHVENTSAEAPRSRPKSSRRARRRRA